MQKDITELLIQAKQGTEDDVDVLINHLLQKLKSNAKSVQSLGKICSQSDIIHLTYFSTIDFKHVSWETRGYFFAICSRCLRHILITHKLNNSATEKSEHGDKYLDHLLWTNNGYSVHQIDAALCELSALNNHLVKIAECKFFGDMSFEDIATAFGISRMEAKRDWAIARGWIYKKINSTSVLY